MGNDQSSGGCNGDCELAGSWVPIRHGEWTNRVPGIPHSARARMPVTKMVYDSNGTGKGWVGEVHVTVILTRLARGQYSATAKAGLFWKGNDGKYTLKSDGTLEAQYPSSGIKEYWKRASGSRSSAPTAASRTAPKKSLFKTLQVATYESSSEKWMQWEWRGTGQLVLVQISIQYLRSADSCHGYHWPKWCPDRGAVPWAACSICWRDTYESVSWLCSYER